mgnify:CR=1 FL=1
MKTQIDKTIIEVWELKDRAYQETKGLSGKAYFDYLRKKVAETFPNLRTATENIKDDQKSFSFSINAHSTAI